MEELKAFGDALLADPKKMNDFLYNAGVTDKEDNFT